jgi:hypothetical protein
MFGPDRAALNDAQVLDDAFARHRFEGRENHFKVLHRARSYGIANQSCGILFIRVRAGCGAPAAGITDYLASQYFATKENIGLIRNFNLRAAAVSRSLEPGRHALLTDYRGRGVGEFDPAFPEINPSSAGTLFRP